MEMSLPTVKRNSLLIRSLSVLPVFSAEALYVSTADSTISSRRKGNFMFHVKHGDYLSTTAPTFRGKMFHVKHGIFGKAFLLRLQSLPVATQAKHEEGMQFIEEHHLMGKGLATSMST
jgi:hypothetical protein